MVEIKTLAFTVHYRIICLQAHEIPWFSETLLYIIMGIWIHEFQVFVSMYNSSLYLYDFNIHDGASSGNPHTNLQPHIIYFINSTVNVYVYFRQQLICEYRQNFGQTFLVNSWGISVSTLAATSPFILCFCWTGFSPTLASFFFCFCLFLLLSLLLTLSYNTILSILLI